MLYGLNTTSVSMYIPTQVEVVVYLKDLNCIIPKKGFFSDLFDTIMYMDVFLAYVSVYYVYSWLPEKSQKRVLGPLELELWMVVNFIMGSENQTWVLCKSSSYLFTYLSIPEIQGFNSTFP